jgi:hypothetical protein
MAEASQYTFSHKELIETLIKKQDLREGIWSLAFQLGMGATQIPSPTDSKIPVPAAVVSIMSVGLQRTDKEGPLALDAAKVNPSK